jgi:hypothetical protein
VLQSLCKGKTVSPLFDGSRWDRLRRFGCSWRWTRGRLTLYADFAAYELPLPHVVAQLNEQVLSLGVSVGDAMNDRLATAALDIELPGALADAVDWVLPDPDGRSGWLERTP